jgi:hypothetical protein
MFPGSVLARTGRRGSIARANSFKSSEENGSPLTPLLGLHDDVGATMTPTAHLGGSPHSCLPSPTFSEIHINR